MTIDRCFACDRQLSKTERHAVHTRAVSSAAVVSPATVFVGTTCWALIVRAGEEGYQPSKGGPRLFASAGPAPV